MLKEALQAVDHQNRDLTQRLRRQMDALAVAQIAWQERPDTGDITIRVSRFAIERADSPYGNPLKYGTIEYHTERTGRPVLDAEEADNLRALANAALRVIQTQDALTDAGAVMPVALLEDVAEAREQLRTALRQAGVMR